MTADATILGCHVYDPAVAGRLVRTLAPLLVVADRVELTSSRPEALEAAQKALAGKHARVGTTLVDNAWHDWSGYLSLLEHSGPDRTLVVCNDSLVSRRMLLGRTRRRFVESLAAPGPRLVGELDTSRESVVVAGASSICWISTYLFALCGYRVDPQALAQDVEQELGALHPDTELYFEQNLAWRRKGRLAPDQLRPKLGAMVFERLLTQQALQRGIGITDYCDSDYVRKVERLAERFKNDRG